MGARPAGRGLARLYLLRLLCLLATTAGCANASAVRGADAPVLISEPGSTRAVAVSSPTFLREPFTVMCQNLFCQGQRTRVMLFAMNLDLSTGEELSSVSADAEDGAGRLHELKVEYVGGVSGHPWMSAVVVELSPDLTEAGDVLVRVTRRGASSNRVRIGVGRVGGGPPDDAGAVPTPAPPFTVSGHVTDGAYMLDGVTVTLTGSQSSSSVVTVGGRFSFGGLPPGGSYTLTPSFGPCYYFTPASLALGALYGNPVIAFSGTVNGIGGRVLDEGGRALGGVSVSLSGTRTEVAQTDAAGAYSFDCLPPGSYTVKPSRVHYSFDAPSRTFDALSGRRTADFTGVVERFTVGGRVTAEGRPLAGFPVALGGSQTLLTFTDAGGAYSFRVPAEGSYTVTPSDKNYYSFAPPGHSFALLAADQSADFAGTQTSPTDPQYVLEFDGSPKTVDYGHYFEPDVDLGPFFWEFWAMPGAEAGATYLLSDGYGGAHALLFGFGFYDMSESGRYQLYGNIWDGAGATSFSSDEGPAVGEWGHFAVGWDGAEVVTYFNGVPVGRAPFGGPRRAGGYINGGGRLLIGGSDHNNLIGRIAQVRGYEGSNPRLGRPGSSRAAFAPETVFRLGGNMLSHYFRPRQYVEDISTGLNGTPHDGRLRGTPFPYGLLTFCEECPRPQYVIDPTAPDFAAGTERAQRQFTPPQPPGGALVFDSFSRGNSTYALGGAGGLGSTEGGAAGPQQWRTGVPPAQAQPFGILNERAVLLGDSAALAWVPTGAAPGGRDVRVERRAGRWGVGLDTGVCFRVADADNYFFAYTEERGPGATARALTLGYYRDGVRTHLATNVAMPEAWATLRVVTGGAGAIDVYADGALVYSTNSGVLSGEKGAGLYNNAAGSGLTNRWDNFIVYQVP